MTLAFSLIQDAYYIIYISVPVTMASRLEPKLLRQIFDLLPRSQNARNAAVCRAWSEEALECVWQVVDAGVFGALGKMVVKNSRGKSTWVSGNISDIV